MPTASLLLLAIVAAGPLAAQRAGDVPRRPRLAAEADSNDARAYFRLGEDLLVQRPAEAADAFFWAAQIDPTWPDPLYGRHAALLLTSKGRLVRYVDGDANTLASPYVRRTDSIYVRAQRMDPFLRPPFDRVILRAYVLEVATWKFGTRSRAEEYGPGLLDSLPPLLRGRAMVAEGRQLAALEAYDEALRQAREGPLWRLWRIRYDRARLFVHAGNDSAALAELGHAVDLALDAEADDELRPFYASRAVLEHGRGLVHERMGDRAAAREAYARALLQDLSYSPAHERLSAVSLLEADSATALGEMALAAQTSPGDPVIRMSYALLLAQTGHLAEAEAEALAAAERAPYWAEPRLLLALVRDGRGGGGALAPYRAFMERARRDDPRRARVAQAIAERSPS